MANLLKKINKTFLLLNLFFLQSYLVRFSIGPYPTNLQEVLIGTTLVTFIIRLFLNKQFLKTIKNIKKHWVILSFIVLTGLSLALILTGTTEISPPLSENLHLIRHCKFLFFALILSFIFIETFHDKKSKNAAIKVAGLGAITFGIFSVIYNLLGHNVAHDLRLLGPLDAAVYLAYYLTPFFLFFSIQLINDTKKKINLIYAIILALLIIATKSMGAIGGGFFVLLIYLIKNKKILKSKASKIVLTIATILIVSTIFYTKILPTLQTEWSSLDERGEIWATSTHILKEPNNALMGLGFGQFEYQYIENVETVLGKQPLDYYVIQPHNILLLFTFHYGVLGLLFIIIVLYKTFQITLEHKPKKEIAYISAFILLYFFTHGLIDTPYFKNDLLILLLIFMETGLVKKTS